MIVKDILNLCDSSTSVSLYYLNGACKPIFLFNGSSSDVPSNLKDKKVHGLCPVSSGSTLGTLVIDLTDYDALNGVFRNEFD
ncbi:MAG: hypothetical protein ACI4DK_07360 [Lachnospiraceae bacterium]